MATYYCKNCNRVSTSKDKKTCSTCKGDMIQVTEKKQYSYYCKTCDSYTSPKKGKCVMCNGSITTIDPFSYSSIKIEAWHSISKKWIDITKNYYKNGKVVTNVSKAPIYGEIKITNAYGNYSYFKNHKGELVGDMVDGYGNTINLRESLSSWKFDSKNSEMSYFYDSKGNLVAIAPRSSIPSEPTGNSSGSSGSNTNSNSNDNSNSTDSGSSSSPNDPTPSTEDTSSGSKWSIGGLFSKNDDDYGKSKKVEDALKFFKDNGEELKEGEIDDYMLGDSYEHSSILNNSIYGGAFGTSVKDEDTELQAKLDAIFNDTTGTIRENPLDRNILGLPLCYNSLADPNREVFCNTMMYDAPLVFITPGKPKMNKKLINASGDKIIDLDDYYERLSEGAEDPDGFSFGILNPKNHKELRYMNFQKNYSEYWKYVQLLTSTVYAWIVAQDPESKLIDKFDFTNEFKESFNNSGVCFYADKSTSISENNSNTYTSSKIAEQVNGSQSITREASLLGNYGTLSKWTNAVYQNTAAFVKDLGVAADSLKSFESILTKTANSFVKIVNGAQLDFPEIWSDSTFDRSYSISFRFYSPYGDRRSVFKYVYVPFLALLAFALPRQDSAFGTVEPFIVRIFAPGWVNIDCGVITQLAITKGGSDGLWTSDGLPQIIEVTAVVQDLYPSLRMPATGKMLKYNSNMCAYLETMAGLRVDQFKGWRAFKSWMNRKLSNSLLSTIDDKIDNFISDAVYNNVIDKISNMFR